MTDIGVGKAVSSGSNTASQLVAKILSQLSLSAWLPAGALVLLVGFIMEFGAAIDSHSGPAAALSTTFVGIGKISVGSLLLVVLAIVVVTTLTQAFSFGAIRVLEGYWGPSRLMELLASARANRHRSKYTRLYARHQDLIATAIDGVLADLTAEQQALAAEGRGPTFTSAMCEVIAARVKATPEPEGLVISDDQRAAANAFDWINRTSDSNLVRRELNLSKKLDDYPRDSRHVLPTRLGNVLRAHEDATELDEVENYVDQVFDELPLSMQLLHDEQRTQLELYCSMVFVLAVTAAVAVARFGFQHWTYQVATLALAGFGCWAVYRAAISSARYYGVVLNAIVAYVANQRIIKDQRRPRRIRAWLKSPT